MEGEESHYLISLLVPQTDDVLMSISVDLFITLKKAEVRSLLDLIPDLLQSQSCYFLRRTPLPALP